MIGLAARAALAGLAVSFASVAIGAMPMGADEARLLLTRTSFAASEGEVARFALMSREEAVDRLLSWVQPEAVVPPPAWTAHYERPSRKSLATREGREADRREQQRRIAELRAWWLAEMMTTPSPLTEKLVLFWHNHFVSAQPKVRIAHLMYAQNALLRRHALGNFRTLLHAIARDPAMLIYLDTAGSRVEAPNENFAREVMELFTLGEGHYGERDIKESARAITGWVVDRQTGAALFRPRLHDGGDKTIFATTGRFDMDAMLDLLLAQPETARFITTKLWKEFVSPTPDPAEVDRLAAIFRSAGYELKPLLRAMLTSDAFYAEANRGTLVKSPVDLVVGTLREFRFQVKEPAPFVNALRQMGQDLFNPPNVKGWPGGETWIHSASLLSRKQLLDRLFRFDAKGEAPLLAGATMPSRAATGTMPSPVDDAVARARDPLIRSIELDSPRWLEPYAGVTGGGQRMTQALLAVAPVRATAATPTLAGIRELVLDPAYQLK